MIEFHKVTNSLYILSKNGVRVSDVPLSMPELLKELEKIELTEAEQITIERFYG